MCAGGQCHPEEGYDWVNPSVSGDRRVKWVPNETSQNYPNVVSSEEEGQWRPKEGYDWVNPSVLGDRRVKWVPNKASQNYPNVVSSEEEGQWRPKEGYDWVNPSVLGDRRVKWVPNKTSQSYPNVVASKEEGYWHPKEGYKFINPHTSDLRVVDNGLVDNAIRATDFATSFKDEKAHLEELSGLDQYDRVEAALTILATNCVITDPLAESAAQREVVITHTKAELRDLMKRAVRASVYQMSGDIKRMVPFSWNPFGDQQRQVLAQTDREIFLLEGRAEDEIDAPANFREIRSGSGKAALEYNSGQALRQLLSINSNRLARGKW
jgi:hypothetical protein